MSKRAVLVALGIRVPVMHREDFADFTLCGVHASVIAGLASGITGLTELEVGILVEA